MRILNTTYIAPMPRTQSVSPASQCLPTEYTTYNNESREMPWSMGKPSPCVSRPQEIKFGQSRLGRNREKSQRSQSSQVSARENTPYRREPQVQKRKERKERGRGAERSQRRADNSVVAAVNRTVFDLCLLWGWARPGLKACYLSFVCS